MANIDISKIGEALNGKADIDLNNTGVFSTNGGGVNLTSSTPSGAESKEVVSADFVLGRAGGLPVGSILTMPFGVDESENKFRYLNGQTIIQSQFSAFAAKVKSWQSTRANLFTTETNWQAEKTASVLGQCGKFVVDDTAGTIRLPCVVNINGLVDLANCGVIKSESLPKPTLILRTDSSSSTDTDLDAIYGNDGYTASTPSNTSATDEWMHRTYTTGNSAYMDIFHSSYQDNAPVQQEAIQYPYCIVVNTGVEEAERPINNYQVNNVYSYGMSQYYKGVMNNNSWLRSQGQWNDGTVYSGVYNWAVEQMNAGVTGFVASTATYTDYDWVINTADQTFRLPLKNGQEGVFADGVKGNGITIGLIDKYGTHLAFGGQGYTSGKGDGYSYTPAASPEAYGSAVGTAMCGYAGSVANTTFGLTDEADKSGIIVDKTVPSGYNLYYYIGDTLQNADLINIARLGEQITDLSARRYVTETWKSGTSWYRIWSDGWIEQGGYDPSTTNGTFKTVTFYKGFTDTNYFLSVTIHSTNGTASTALPVVMAGYTQKSTAYFTRLSSALPYMNGVDWYACGY